MFVNMHVYGTPEACYERIVSIADTLGADGYVGVFGYSDVPYEEAERSMRLFAREVLPELKKLAPAAERTAVAP
jgi:hypothetical protein